MSGLMDAARSGMIEHERNVERISNNIANANTPGYKRVAVSFNDVFDSQQVLDLVEGLSVPPPVQTTSAVATGEELRNFEAGSLSPTGRALDLAIEGEGFFQVELPDGTTALTRVGSFYPDGEGRLVTANGYRLVPAITIEAGFSSVTVEATGSVTAISPETGERVELGVIELARVANPTGLESIGEGLYRTTASSGDAEAGTPGADSMGALRSGAIEDSNVELTEEMTNLTVAQRSFQMNAALYRYADQMYEQANQLSA